MYSGPDNTEFIIILKVICTIALLNVVDGKELSNERVYSWIWVKSMTAPPEIVQKLDIPKERHHHHSICQHLGGIIRKPDTYTALNIQRGMKKVILL